MREVRFLVASIHRDGPRLFVGGRNCGDALAVGDVVRGLGGDVRVEAILTYRRYLNVLDPGLTAELELSGDGIEPIQPGSDLIGTLQTGLPPLILRKLSATVILLANSKSSNFNGFQSGYPGGTTK